MTIPNIELRPLQENDRDRFIRDNQDAFRYGAMEEFGPRDDHFEEPGEIISRRTIEESIDSGTALRIVHNGENVGGAVVKVEGEIGDLELLFIKPEEHSKGLGYAAWCAIERMYPGVRVWTACTPYFEKRNIHFYVNRCGFRITEFYCSRHPDPDEQDKGKDVEMFHFEKVIGDNGSGEHCPTEPRVIRCSSRARVRKMRPNCQNTCIRSGGRSSTP